MLVCKALEIYISGQVNTLNKTLKLSYASKVFCCGWQTIPNFNNTIASSKITPGRPDRTPGPCPRAVRPGRAPGQCVPSFKQAYNAKYDPNTTLHELTD